jgi:hypothetical protein
VWYSPTRRPHLGRSERSSAVLSSAVGSHVNEHTIEGSTPENLNLPDRSHLDLDVQQCRVGSALVQILLRTVSSRLMLQWHEILHIVSSIYSLLFFLFMVG